MIRATLTECLCVVPTDHQSVLRAQSGNLVRIPLLTRPRSFIYLLRRSERTRHPFCVQKPPQSDILKLFRRHVYMMMEVVGINVCLALAWCLCVLFPVLPLTCGSVLPCVIRRSCTGSSEERRSCWVSRNCWTWRSLDSCPRAPRRYVTQNRR